jgi:multicomponent Na+:H+ antiporter subunit D
MIFAMLCLSVIIIAFGLFPDVIVDKIVAPAANALVNSMEYIAAILGGA